GKAETGWALNGARFGEDRVAIIVPRTPFGFDEGTLLRIRIRHDSNYTKHAIGRVRLAVTTDETLAVKLAPSAYSSWQVVGPFAAENGKAAHQTDFGPEQGIDPDAALRQGNEKFTRRFNYIEESLAKENRLPTDAGLDEMETLWGQAKAAEKAVGD
ncbi:MAG: hypothetical protein O7C63_01715, partial [Alphaproteobacteria bacterium]|nr:hypothetical protein [Alphaproteobacteria bacterium]